MTEIDVRPELARVSDGPTKDARFWRPTGLLLVGMLVVTCGVVVTMATTEDRLLVGGMGLLLMLLLMLLRVPVALALIIPGLLGIFVIGGPIMLESMVSRIPYNSIASWSLSVIPMFVFMGLLVATTGIAQSIYRAAQHWLWWMPGGLAVGTNLAGAGLAAVSGSTMGSAYALARIGVPEMLRMGYNKRVAIMAVMAAGLPGQLIPPSILLVIYAGIVQTPVGPQLMAGVFPGLLVAIAFALIMLFMAITTGGRNGGQVDRSHRTSLTGLVKVTLRAWPVPILILIIIGGMFSGIFTATEAGAAAALVVAVLGVTQGLRSRDWTPMRDAVVGTLRSTGMIFLLLIGATFLTEMFTLTGVSTHFEIWVSEAGFNRTTFLLVMIGVYILLGMAMDTLAMMMLTIPVLVPTLESLDIPLVFFGVFVVLIAEIGMLTPPVGILAYILHGLFQDPKVNLGQKITLRDVFTAVAWILPGAVLVLLLLIWFPEIATYLPDSMSTSAEP